MSALRMFIPLTKVDAETRTVYGIATGETADRSGEVCDYASTKPHYEAWSGEIAKASGGKSFGNLRAMHGKVAAGKMTAITFNDASKQIEIAAKVVDDNEWQKVQEGVYTGFSQGGSYAKRWTDPVTGLQRYTAVPSEVSLVDLPCLKEATFTMVKAAGVAEERRFAEAVQVEPAAPSAADVNAKAVEMAKAAGRETAVVDFFEPARVALVKAALPALPEAPIAAEASPPGPREADGVEQVWKAKDGSTHAKKADALAKNAEIDAAAAVEPGTKATLDALDALGSKLGLGKAADTKWTVSSKKDGKTKTTTHDTEGAAVDEARSRDSADHSDVICRHGDKGMVSWKKPADKAVTADDLAKSMDTVSSLSSLLSSLAYLRRRVMSETAGVDDSAQPKAIADLIENACGLLQTMVDESCSSILDAGLSPYPEPMYYAAGMKAGQAALDGCLKAVDAREGAPLVKGIATDRLTALVVALEKAGARNSKSDMSKIQAMHDHACDLGAACKGGDAGKAASGGDLAKALDTMTAERDQAKARGDALQKTMDDRILPMLKAISDKVENIEKQPLPLPFQGGARVVSKGGEPVDAADLGAQLLKMQAEDPAGFGLLMIKAAQQNPQQMQLAR